MTEYSDAVDREIQEAPRSVQPGDLVRHKDDPFRELGWVFALDDDGKASVHLMGLTVQDGIPVDRLVFVERPEAYACVEFNGHDDVDNTTVSYAFVDTGTAQWIADSLDLYRKINGYTVLDSFVPCLVEESVQDTETDDETT